MKKILLLLLISIIPLGIFGQVAATDATPDTIPDGGSRTALRDANNWNILRNDVDRETFSSDSSKTATDTLESSTDTVIIVDDDLATTLGGWMLNEAATSSNPTIIPYNGRTNTGLGGDDQGGMYLIESGSSRISLTHDDGNYFYGQYQRFPDLGGTGTGTSIINYNRATGLITYADQLSYTAGDGLTLTGSAFHLGGTVSTNRTIDSDEAVSLYLRSNVAGDNSALLGVYDGGAVLTGYSDPGYSITNGYSLFRAKDDVLHLEWAGSGSNNTFVMNSTATTFTDNINSKGIYYGGDYSNGATDGWIADKRYVDGQIDSVYSDSITFTSCTYNSTTNFNIGTTNDMSFFIRYVAYRTMAAVVTYQFGTIEVGYNPSTAVVYYSSGHIGPSIGESITADVSGGNIRLNIAIDNTNTNNASFSYTIISKLY